MTSNAVLAAIFLAPVAMSLVIGMTFLATEGGDLAMLAYMTTIPLVAGGFIFVIARLVMGWMPGEHPRRLAAFAAELGGEVLTNMIGERQLRLPHPRGRIELDFRQLGGDSDSPGDPFTRVALVAAAGSMPGERHKLSGETCAEDLRTEARAEIAALRAAFGGQTRVHLLGRAREPAVEVWVHGFITEPAIARRTLELARPHLEALASHPWSG